LYTAAFDLPYELYRRSTGVFFGSPHGALNHLVADRLWLERLTNSTGDVPNILARFYTMICGTGDRTRD
jgi:uncharacterized damage-inducible protein DinB